MSWAWGGVGYGVGFQLHSEALGNFLADRFAMGTCPKCKYEVGVGGVGFGVERMHSEMLGSQLVRVGYERCGAKSGHHQPQIR